MKTGRLIIQTSQLAHIDSRQNLVSTVGMKTRLRKIAGKVGYVAGSVWLAFHVFSVFIAPASMPPASPLLMDGYRMASPYADAMFLNHGYHYFAPDPGASTLISYTVPREGDTPVMGRFPTIEIRPRLLYHRYFMLAENIGGFPEDTQTEVYAAYARHFAGLHHSSKITLNRIAHEPSSIARILAGGKLFDRSTFSEELIETYDFDSTKTSSASVGF